MNISKSILLTGVAVILATGLAACDKEKPAETAGRSIDQATGKAGDKMAAASENLGEQSDRAGVAVGDTAITTKVKAAILAEPGLKVLQINVDTAKGVTTLSGTVDSQQSSDRAREIATAVAGVKEVKNQLLVNGTN
ncbi:MAG: transport-associated protein [Gammaproteobacteria bacterium]|nr:MAG: transport-associated protein [Gammaproteobacteria bacterium]TND01953.1 MAG: transport-associated protein [Gammaproteobacteria bacterium]